MPDFPAADHFITMNDDKAPVPRAPSLWVRPNPLTSHLHTRLWVCPPGATVWAVCALCCCVCSVLCEAAHPHPTPTCSAALYLLPTP